MWLAFLEILDRLRGPRPNDPEEVRARLLAVAGLGSGQADQPGTVGGAAEMVDPTSPVLGAPGPVREPTAAAVRALVVVGVLAVVLAGFFVWRSQGGQVVPVTVTADATTAPTGSAPVPSAAVLVVQVLGQVRRPGVVRVPAGSRVVDAITAAGGLRKGGSSGLLNLARKVDDGEQIVVGPDAVPDAGAAPGSSAGAMLDLNTADQAALETLPGVGPVTAAAILAWRTEHGGFDSVDQLREVDGIGPKTYDRLAPLVTVSPR